jgi:alpha-L-fucosidase 2
MPVGVLAMGRSAFGMHAAAMDLPDVIWTTPSTDEHGSMPLGNGETGLNLWTENGRDLCLYVARTDAWDGEGRLCKLGRVRIRLPDGVFGAGAPFLQRLDLATGCVRIRADGLAITVIADAHAQAARVRIEAREAVSIEVLGELWRRDRRITDEDELFSFARQDAAFAEVRECQDDILDAGAEAIAWCQWNRRSMWAGSMANQFMAGHAAAHASEDPLLQRGFGCLVHGDGLRRGGALRLHGEAQRIWEVAVVGACARIAEPAGLLSVLAAVRLAPWAEALAAHTAWWQAFWQRSWIRVRGDAAAEAVDRAYVLQRYIFACSGRGAYPIKFNGSLFTVTGRDKGKTFTPDWRRWGGCYWFQNTRLAYWPMLMAGDHEMVRPLFRMYLDCLVTAEARTRVQHGLPGATMPETVTFWGMWGDCDYGYPAVRARLHAGDSQGRPDYHPFAGPDDRHAICGYLRRYFQGTIELLALGLDHHAIAPDADWVRSTLLPLARSYLTFFAAYWPQRDARGRMLLSPAMSLETWQDADNPLPEIAGLGWVLDGLLSLTEIEASDRATWSALRAILPPLPQRWLGGNRDTHLLPAERYTAQLNCENPELYAVFPYRRYGVGKADLEVGRTTWKRRQHAMGAKGWCQDPIQAAMLGLADEARSMVASAATAQDPGSRFPAFWGPNFDWTPDQDHGGVLMIALQRMLVQAEAGTVQLMPAWPTGWDADFRLHVPGGTISGACRDGKLVELSLPAGVQERRHVIQG